ncbi:POU domain, class 6, transcription factor 1 isoform X1 [Pleurodeles waltl]|uniref:POU domain, class 6, transcription factor 1 isoform X1 n=2 Tax=Pleurodeles waltl TaxID=8319 RepID=UPI003709660C
MDPGSVPHQEAALTVNEQVIVMSGQETIRVLEVGVDAPVEAEEAAKASEPEAAEATGNLPGEISEPAREAVQLNPETPSHEPVVKSSEGMIPTPVPTVFTSAASQPQQTVTPFALQAAPQLLTQDSIAALLAGVMTPATTVTQPLLIPISIASPIGGQQGLTVWNFPTATVATLPGMTAPTNATGVLKLPFSNLQTASVLNTNLQATVQAPQVFQVQQTAQPAVQQQPLVSVPAALQPQVTAMVQASVQKPLDAQAQYAVQPAGFAFNPTIISAATFGGQAQLLGSLTASPLITSAIPGMQGITGQIITNAQGQVVGTLPWVLNSAGFTANAAPAALPAQNVQVQSAATPQLLLNAQGQVIATLANSAAQPPPIRKQSAPEVLKAEQMPVMHPIQPAPTVSQPPPAITNTPLENTSCSTPVTITCSETPTVGQLVSKPQTPSVNEDGINLEEIREFAKNFKIRRLSLGLTQTQVGQALTATEGPAYSQSAICRFEKLDITPKSAQKLKPVLEKWLNEAELRNQEGQQNLMEFVGGEPSKKRKRRTSFTPQAIEILNAYFEKNALPTGQEITEIAKELNYDREVVRVWFCNRRQTLKNTSKLNIFQIP